MTLKKLRASGEGHNAIFDSDFVLHGTILSIELLDYELKETRSALDARIARLTEGHARKRTNRFFGERQ
jgi:hypothetical protein